MVAGDGVEPPFQGSEPCVLPLHQPTIFTLQARTANTRHTAPEAQRRGGERAHSQPQDRKAVSYPLYALSFLPPGRNTMLTKNIFQPQIYSTLVRVEQPEFIAFQFQLCVFIFQCLNVSSFGDTHLNDRVLEPLSQRVPQFRHCRTCYS